ncbi:MAG: RDD family protein [Actinomycetota bacterium]
MREDFNFTLQDFLLSALLSVLYFSLLEGRPSGQTVGKRLFRIRVVDFERGTPIDYRRALARSIGKILSGVPLGLGYLWMLWDRDRQTWHDKLSFTTVANVQRLGVG